MFIPPVKPLLVELAVVGTTQKTNRNSKTNNNTNGQCLGSPKISPFPNLPDMSPKKVFAECICFSTAVIEGWPSRSMGFMRKYSTLLVNILEVPLQKSRSVVTCSRKKIRRNMTTTSKVAKQMDQKRTIFWKKA